jgi:hypothetical protein
VAVRSELIQDQAEMITIESLAEPLKISLYEGFGPPPMGRVPYLVWTVW